MQRKATVMFNINDTYPSGGSNENEKTDRTRNQTILFKEDIKKIEFDNESLLSTKTKKDFM